MVQIMNWRKYFHRCLEIIDFGREFWNWTDIVTYNPLQMTQREYNKSWKIAWNSVSNILWQLLLIQMLRLCEKRWYVSNYPVMGWKLGSDYVVAFDIIQEVNHLWEINVVGETYKISFYLGGDWKFLAVVTGIDAASSDYACISCKCWKEDRSDITQRWSIKIVSSGARTTEENEELAGRPHVCKVYNVSHEPLFLTIPLSNVVIDKFTFISTHLRCTHWPPCFGTPLLRCDWQS